MAEKEGVQHYIPMSREEVKEHLYAMAGSHRDDLERISEMLEALWHHRIHGQQEALKRAYEDLDPDWKRPPRPKVTVPEFLTVFEEVLEDGNWVEISNAEMDAALEGEDIFPISLDVRFDEFEVMRMFKLGQAVVEDERDPPMLARLFGAKPKVVEMDTYDRIIQALQFKDTQWFIDNKRQRHDPGPEADGLHLRLFKSIPKLDLEVIFPNTTPKMRGVDKLKIGAPLIGGLVTLGMKFGPLLFGAGSGDTSLAVVGGLSAALGTYILKTWMKYQKTRERYLSQVSKDLYFKGQANNQAVIHMVIDLSEEQEVKEALLAYAFLLMEADAHHTMATLDDRIEDWLSGHGVEVDFEVEDAAAKLQDLGLLLKDGEKLMVLPAQGALARLDEIWDNLYDYNA